MGSLWDTHSVGDTVTCIRRAFGLTKGRDYVVTKKEQNGSVIILQVTNDCNHIEFYEQEYFAMKPPTLLFEAGCLATCISPAGGLTVGKRYRVESSGYVRCSARVRVTNDLGISDVYRQELFDQATAETEAEDSKKQPKSKLNEQPKPHPFWMVVGPHYSCQNAIEYSSEDEARREANELARNNPGVVFTVMGPIAAYHKSDVQETDLRDYLERGEGDVPF